ncbi:hypothetical protein DHEL01_v204442 [Diaporthe helianthi]|uniref:Uncharacterized protein n=1 Tax=Diaporthe helianthi TaxID=158607 RepID=A0A2P5I3T5_DIAHE|nr:hypothetical protein DHEL01_v204442 [Diaporthe helianthi]
MVSIKSLAVATLAAVPSVMAKVSSFKAPAEAAAGSNITVTFQTASYSQNWVDFGVAFSIQSPENAVYKNTIGLEFGFTALTGQEGLVYPYTFDLDATIPADIGPGEFILHAAIPYLAGASGSIGWNILNSTITITAPVTA